jgi:hypothetical protein
MPRCTLVSQTVTRMPPTLLQPGERSRTDVPLIPRVSRKRGFREKTGPLHRRKGRGIAPLVQISPDAAFLFDASLAQRATFQPLSGRFDSCCGFSD